jgi:hypothetical protein
MKMDAEDFRVGEGEKADVTASQSVVETLKNLHASVADNRHRAAHA